MKQKAKRIAWGMAGFSSLGLGVAGIPLPLLPTTPFLLLAAFCFARSSQRWHDWLVDHKHFGPPIKDWRAHGAIPLRAKIIASVMMVGAFLAAFAVGAPATALIAQLIILPLVALFIWTRPGGPRKSVQDADVTPPQDPV